MPYSAVFNVSHHIFSKTSNRYLSHQTSSFGALVEAASAIVAPLDVASVSRAVCMGTLAVEDAAKAKVGLSTEGAKDVANVVGRLNASSKGAVPAGENSPDDLDTGQVNVLNRGSEATLVVDQQMVKSGSIRRGTVKVRGYSLHQVSTLL